MVHSGNYEIFVEVTLPYEQAREKTIAALKEQGFGVLTEIDVKETLKKKLDVDFRRYTILGACNPPLAYRALSNETHIGVLLPCNVVVYEKDDWHSVIVAIDPEVQLGKVGRPELAEVAREVKGRLSQVIESVAA